MKAQGKSSFQSQSPLRHLQCQRISNQVEIEVKRREIYLPSVSVFRWWARRSCAVTGSVIDAVTKDYGPNLRISDPFAGGGTVAIEAARRGHRVHAQDIDPWSVAGITACLTLPSPDVIDAAKEILSRSVAKLLSRAYETEMEDGEPATISQTLRVRVGRCPSCRIARDLFPQALVSRLTRVDAQGDSSAWVVCENGHLQLGSAAKRKTCRQCNRRIDPSRRYIVDRTLTCSECKSRFPVKAWLSERPAWKPVLVVRCTQDRREIQIPNAGELRQANTSWRPKAKLPAIMEKGECALLVRHKFRNWHDIYPKRQRVVIEALLNSIPVAASGDRDLERALTMAVIGSTEMAGYLSRWDPQYLKSYEVMAGHRFSLTTLAAEPNVWGAALCGRGTVSRRLRLIRNASAWNAGRQFDVRCTDMSANRRAKYKFPSGGLIVSGSSSCIPLQRESVDLIWTDPPYHDDVQYHDLSSPFRAWGNLGQPEINQSAVATEETSKNYESVLRCIFHQCHRILTKSGRLILTFSNKDARAWIALLRALKTAQFKAVGFQVVRSDAKSDYAKRRGKACSMDLILDLVRSDYPVRCQIFKPKRIPANSEAQFLGVTGDLALSVLSDRSPPNWTNLLRELQKERQVW